MLKPCRRRGHWLAYYAGSALAILVGVTLGVETFRVDTVAGTEPPPSAEKTELAAWVTRRSADAYRRIAQEGYSYHPDRPSLVAFFPAYPLAARGTAWLLGIRTEMAIALVAVGAAKGWLNRYESSLAAGLILVPYVLRGHEMSMAAMGRFTVVAVPLYLVMGRLLRRCGPAASSIVLALAALVLAVYGALFAAGYALL